MYRLAAEHCLPYVEVAPKHTSMRGFTPFSFLLRLDVMAHFVCHEKKAERRRMDRERERESPSRVDSAWERGEGREKERD